METKLILLTMVKNESRIIQRLLGSVKGRVDAAVVCDTGSTDNTIELANAYMAESGLAGKVFSFPFETFGASRTKSFECCQEYVAQRGWDASKCWALLLDGDMMLSAPVDIHSLANAPANIAGVSLKQANGSLVYSNMRILRCSEPWICKGATHEAWTCPPARSTVLFESPVLTDHGDGGCKSDKYERDVRLLKGDLEKMPDDARTLFYLGQTYLCMRDYENAIPILKRRVEAGGWDEENYIARVYLGECLEGAGRTAEAAYAWLDAWQYRQHRTEAPIRLITLFRKQPKSQFIAMMYLEKLFATQFGENFTTGESAGPPANNRDILFVNRRDVDYHIWEEMLILAFYTGHGRQAWLHVDKLDLTTKLGWHDFNSLFGQIHWYDWLLKPRRQQRLLLPLERLPWSGEDQAGCWQPFNPSLRQKPDGSGYQLNLRYANYYTQEAKHYHYRGFHGQVLTRNVLTDVPREAAWNSPAALEEIKIDPRFPQNEAHYIRGIEDCRLIAGSDRQEFLGTSQSYSKNGTNKIFHVWKEPGDAAWSLRQMPLPPGISEGETQKNWMGFRHGPSKELLYIYSYSPFRVCDASGNYRVQVDTTQGPLSLKEYRGSAGPTAWSSSVETDEIYLCVMHKVYIGGEGRRYYHRFLTLDKDLKPSRVSCWVRFTSERVEYWSGMCQSLEGDSYWVTYGTQDSQAYIAELKKEEIEKLLFYSLKRGTVAPFATRAKATF
jgi:glycosyltransferase involved in cell wall biosynthesis